MKPPSTDHVRRFDQVAHDYVGNLDRNLRLAGGDSRPFYEAKVDLIRTLGPEHPRVVFDYGCGVGILSRMLADAYPEAAVIGFDPSTEQIRVARATAARDATRLCFESTVEARAVGADIAVAAGVFHHIPRERQAQSVSDVADALAPGGRLFVFEHNPYSPLARLIVALARVDRGADLVAARAMRRMAERAGLIEAEVRYISFFPPFLKPLLRLEPYLRAVPVSAQYMLTARKP